MFIICGLGNPGNRYTNTRHNVGFDTIDLLSKKHKIPVSKLKFKALFGKGNIGKTKEKVILVKPQTYMNLSGESILDIVSWHKSDLSKLIIIYDDIDLDIGRLRIRPGGSAGSHNGMKSVIYNIGEDEFPRVRIGIGKQPDYMELTDYVLSKFSGPEQKIIDDSIIKAAEACEEIIINGIDSAMNKFNS